MLVANMALQSSADALPCRSVFVFEEHFRFCRFRMCGDLVNVFLAPVYDYAGSRTGRVVHYCN